MYLVESEPTLKSFEKLFELRTLPHLLRLAEGEEVESARSVAMLSLSRGGTVWMLWSDDDSSGDSLRVKKDFIGLMECVLTMGFLIATRNDETGCTLTLLVFRFGSVVGVSEVFR